MQFSFHGPIGLIVAMAIASTTVCSAEDIVINGSFEDVGSNGLTAGWGAGANGYTDFSFVTDWATDGERAAMLGVQSGVGSGRAFLVQAQRLLPQETVQLVASFDAIVDRTGSPETFVTLEIFNNERPVDSISEFRLDLLDTAGIVQRFEVGPVFVPALGEFPNDEFSLSLGVYAQKSDAASTARIFVDNFRIDLTSVPEPASWTLIVVSLFVLVQTLRRRRR